MANFCDTFEVFLKCNVVKVYSKIDFSLFAYQKFNLSI